MKNYSSLTDIMINKLSKFILTDRKGIFFPIENMMCAKECVQ